MVLGILILVAAIFLLIVFISKNQTFQSKFMHIIIGTLIMFLVFSVGYVFIISDIKLSSFYNLLIFSKAYFSWLSHLAKNTGKVAGYVINQNCGVNETASDIIK